MNHPRAALALASFAIILSVWLTGVQPAATHPYDGAAVVLTGTHQLLSNGDEGQEKSTPSTLVTVAIGCGVLALASLAFYVINGRDGDD